MTQEQIRETWQEAASRFYAPTPDEFEAMYRRNKETALEQLARKYKRFSRLGLIMGIMCCCYMLPNMAFPEHLRIWITLSFCTYFLIASAMDYWLYKGVSAIDCFTMTVSDVAEKAMYYKRKHLQFIAMLLPMAFAVIGLIIYAGGGNKYLIAGVLFGALVGGCIGYRQYLDFMGEYKKLAS